GPTRRSAPTSTTDSELTHNDPRPMRVCMISPHLPPEQGANALLPAMLGDALIGSGIESSYVAHPPARRSPVAAHADGGPWPRRDVSYVSRRSRSALGRTVAGAAAAAARMAWGMRAAIASSDVVHLHSNGLIVEVGARVARHYRKPFVITLYGTDVWHHD